MRVKSEARRQAITETAGALFLRDGYAAVSMAGVAAEMGLTRVTLYGYFPTKEELFRAFLTEAGRQQSALLFESQPTDHVDLQGRLKLLGLSYLELVLNPRIVEIQRLIIGEARRFPEMANIFYEIGPRAVLEHVKRQLAPAVESGELSGADLRLTALQFMALCEVTLKDRCLWGLDGEPGKLQMQQAVDDAVGTFLCGRRETASA